MIEYLRQKGVIELILQYYKEPKQLKTVAARKANLHQRTAYKAHEILKKWGIIDRIISDNDNVLYFLNKKGQIIAQFLFLLICI